MKLFSTHSENCNESSLLKKVKEDMKVGSLYRKKIKHLKKYLQQLPFIIIHVVKISYETLYMINIYAYILCSILKFSSVKKDRNILESLCTPTHLM